MVSFPSLQVMLKRGRLIVPVIGVVEASWTLERVRDTKSPQPLQELQGKFKGPFTKRFQGGVPVKSDSVLHGIRAVKCFTGCIDG